MPALQTGLVFLWQTPITVCNEEGFPCLVLWLKPDGIAALSSLISAFFFLSEAGNALGLS